MHESFNLEAVFKLLMFDTLILSLIAVEKLVPIDWISSYLLYFIDVDQFKFLSVADLVSPVVNTYLACV